MMPRVEGFGGRIVTNKQPHGRPIIFAAESVLGILSGDKTQTRRVIKPQPIGGNISIIGAACSSGFAIGRLRDSENAWRELPCLYWVGQVLWVKEAFAIQSECEGDEPPFSDGRPVRRCEDPDGGPHWLQPHYRATDPPPDLCCENQRCKCCYYGEPGPHWRSPMFMPRWASRITLEITDVRVQRVQEISEEDAMAEGCRYPGHPATTTLRGAYSQLWDTINVKRGFPWYANPWCWCISFRVDHSAAPEAGVGR